MVEGIHIAVSDPGTGALSIVFVVTNDGHGIDIPIAEHEARIADVLGKMGKAGHLWRRVDLSEFPADRRFRDAWRHDGKFSIDMPTARNVARSEIRARRAPALAKLDIEYQRADEAQDAAAKFSITSRKQALRDAPAHPAIESAKTVPKLIAAIETALGDD